MNPAVAITPAFELGGAPGVVEPVAGAYDPEAALLDDSVGDEFDGAEGGHALRTAPIVTGDVFNTVGAEVFPQRAVYGSVISQHAEGFLPEVDSRKLYINTNAPFSALVCGVQGSGKSHTTSVFLESCLIKDERIGTLPAPLAGILFHFDTAAGGGLVQPAEAAYLASLDATRGGNAVPPRVVVLVFPSNITAMKQVYAGLPNVTVEPLHFAPTDISGERLLAIMKIDGDDKMPLYMEAIMGILRSMQRFNYDQFRAQLKAQSFNGGQEAMMNIRLGLLDACLSGGNMQNRAANHFRSGQLTIVDLSSPFMDGSSACGFFDLMLGLFIEAETDASGKLVVLDEAHKYLSETGSSSRLTESLLSVVRQQRHLGTRVVVSTQEPTVVPSKFIDLCSFVIAHRFSSPVWLKHLAQHVSAADTLTKDWFGKVVALRTGQAMLFAPAGLGVRADANPDWATPGVGRVAPLGQGYLLVRSRARITRDGGHSILAVADPERVTRLARVAPELGPSLPSAGWGTTGSTSSTPTLAGSPTDGSVSPASSSAVPFTSAKTTASAFSSLSFSPPAAAPAVSWEYEALVEFLRAQLRNGKLWVTYDKVKAYRQRHLGDFPQRKFDQYMQDAQNARMITVDGAKVQLVSALT